MKGDRYENTFLRGNVAHWKSFKTSPKSWRLVQYQPRYNGFRQRIIPWHKPWYLCPFWTNLYGFGLVLKPFQRAIFHQRKVFWYLSPFTSYETKCEIAILFNNSFRKKDTKILFRRNCSALKELQNKPKIAMIGSVPTEIQWIPPNSVKIYYKVQSTNYKVQSTNYKVQSTKYKVQTTNYKLQTTNYKLQIWYTKVQTMVSLFVLNQSLRFWACFEALSTRYNSI